MKMLIIIGSIIAIVASSSSAFAQAACGLRPMTPMPAMGCQAMVPICICDETGSNCRWQYICQPYGQLR